MTELSLVAVEITQSLADYTKSTIEKLPHTKIVDLYRRYSEEQSVKKPHKSQRTLQLEFGAIFKKSYAWSNNYATLLGLTPSILKRVDRDSLEHIPFAVAVQLAKRPKGEQEEFLKHGISQTGGAPKKLEALLAKENRNKRLALIAEQRKRFGPSAGSKIIEIESKIKNTQDHLYQAIVEMKKLVEDIHNLKLLYVIPEFPGKPELQEKRDPSTIPSIVIPKLIPTESVKAEELTPSFNSIPLTSAKEHASEEMAIPLPMATKKENQRCAMTEGASWPSYISDPAAHQERKKEKDHKGYVSTVYKGSKY